MSYTKNSSNYHDYMDRWYSNSYEEYMDYRYWQEEQKKKRWYNRPWAKLTAMASWFDNKKGYAPTPGKFVPIFDESIKLPEGSYYPHPVKGSRWVPAAADDLEAHVRLVLFTPQVPMISYKRLVFNILLLAFSVVMCIGTKMLYPLIFLFLWKPIK